MDVVNVGGYKAERCRDAHLSRMTGRAPPARGCPGQNADTFCRVACVCTLSTLPSFFSSLLCSIYSLHSHFLCLLGENYDRSPFVYLILSVVNRIVRPFALSIIPDPGYYFIIIQRKEGLKRIEERSKVLRDNPPWLRIRSNRRRKSKDAKELEACFLLSSDEPRIPI